MDGRTDGPTIERTNDPSDMRGQTNFYKRVQRNNKTVATSTNEKNLNHFKAPKQLFIFT